MSNLQPNERLYDLILRLKQETSSITNNPLLDGIDLKKIEDFEEKAKLDINYKNKLHVIKTALQNADFIHTAKYNSAFDAYNEIVIYELLNEKIKADFVNLVKGKKTPDYILSTDEYSCYADLKTTHFVNGNLNYIEIQEDGAKAKINLEKEMKKGDRKVYFSDAIVISPFKKGNNGNHRNIQYIIEELIKKIKGLIKLEQINYNETKGILIIDTVNMYLNPQLELGLPIHYGIVYKELVSGILWNVAFGEIGDPTYNWVEFSGLPNIGKRLTMNGILKEDALKSLRALVFIVGHNEKKKIIGFHRTNEKNEQMLFVLNNLCDFVNNELNSEYYRIDEIIKRNQV